VGVLNSLRIVGHKEELVFVDAGLRPDQRRRLAEHATIIGSERALPAYLLKLSPGPPPTADVRVLVDADVLVVRPLTELLTAAREGKLVAFTDPVAHRSHDEWSSLLGLPPVRKQPYVNAGVLAVGEELGRRLLPLVVEATKTLDISRSQHGSGSVDEPFYFYDQDVLNAVLASEAPPDRLVILPHRLAPHPPFPGLELVDRRTLRCRYHDGTEPFLLHHVLAKPWLRSTRRSIYEVLLRRLLLGEDVPLRLDPGELPLRFREGPLASMDRARADLIARARAQRGRLGIRARLRKRSLRR
jgi:hypothetical protein